jgi:putative oxidoreductase
MTREAHRLYFRWLGPAYDRLRPLSCPMLRVAAGLIMIPHGVPKLFGSFAPTLAKNVLAPLGLPGPIYWAYFLGTLEILGGVLLAAGFLTRLFAVMFAVETAMIFAFASLPKGWIYSVPGWGCRIPGTSICDLFRVDIQRGRWLVDRFRNEPGDLVYPHPQR